MSERYICERSSIVRANNMQRLYREWLSVCIVNGLYVHRFHPGTRLYKIQLHIRKEKQMVLRPVPTYRIVHSNQKSNV